MSNGFLPEQPTHEEKPVATPELSPELQAPELGGGVDEYAKAEREAEKEFAEKLEEEKGFLEQVGEEAVASVPAAGASGSTPLPKDDVMIEVEDILQEGLLPMYEQLPPDAKLRFQKKGLEVSATIADMVRRFHVNTKKVVLLIRDWLLTIPGVNKFFLEQEAKIKTDKIVTLEQVRKQDQQNTPL